MGQNLRVVEEAVQNLKKSNKISSAQAQAFMEDYEYNSQNIKDVAKFMDSPDSDLGLYLKYFINNRYSANQQKDKARQTRYGVILCPRMSEENENQIYTKILKHYKKMNSKIKIVYESISQTCITNNLNSIRLSLSKLLEDLLGIFDFQILEKREETILHYFSEGEYSSFSVKGSKGYQRLSLLFEQEENWFQVDQQNKKVRISCHDDSQGRKRIFLFRIREEKQCFLEFLKGTEEICPTVSEFTQRLLSEYPNYNFSQQENKKIENHAKSGLVFLETALDIHDSLIKEELRQILGQSFDEALSLEQLMGTYSEERANCNENLKLLLHRLIKREKFMKKEREYISMYKSAVNEEKMVIALDPFLNFKFCYGSKGHNMMINLQRLKSTEKAIDIFKQENCLKVHINQAKDGEFPEGISSYQYESFSADFDVLDSILHRIHIYESPDKQEAYENENQAELKLVAPQREGKEGKSWVHLFEKDESKLRSRKEKSKICHIATRFLKNVKYEKMSDAEIYSCDCDILQLRDEGLNSMVWNIMERNEVFKLLVCEAQECGRFCRFLAELKFNYNVGKNSFHNYHHAVSVLQTCSIILREEKNSQYLSDLQTFSVLFSGLCHDVGHTGFTNSFEISTFSPKAIAFNDISPLENYHAAKTFELLRVEDKNFLHKMDKASFKQLKKNTIHNILHTDMKQHFSLMENFKNWKSAPQSNETLTAMIVHTSDFGGAAKEFSTSQEWSRRVNCEFARQYEKECELGVNPTLMMKDVHLMSKWACNEIGFLSGIVVPLYRQMCGFYSQECGLMRLYSHVEENIRVWKVLLEKEKK